MDFKKYMPRTSEEWKEVFRQQRASKLSDIYRPDLRDLVKTIDLVSDLHNWNCLHSDKAEKYLFFLTRFSGQAHNPFLFIKKRSTLPDNGHHHKVPHLLYLPRTWFEKQYEGAENQDQSNNEFIKRLDSLAKEYSLVKCPGKENYSTREFFAHFKRDIFYIVLSKGGGGDKGRFNVYFTPQDYVKIKTEMLKKPVTETRDRNPVQNLEGSIFLS